MEITFFGKTAVLTIAALINLLLALSVFRNNPKSATNRVYGLLSVVIILWMVANYLSLLPGLLDISLLLIRFSLFFATAMSALFLLFAHTIPGDKLGVSRRRLVVLSLITIFVMLDTISPFTFTKVNIVNNSPTPVPGPGIGFFTLVTTVFSIMAVVVLIKKLHKAEGSVKQQIRYVLFGIGLMLGSIIVTVLLPVLIFKVSAFVSLIPLYTLFFLGLTAFSIIRHRLFDIRTVIARSVAYLLMVTVFVALYTGAAFVISYAFFNDGTINTRRHITYITLALVFTPTVYWLKRVFDRVTNRLFYQDAYDPQAVLDELSSRLVGNIELEKILQNSRKVITNNIKITDCIFAIAQQKDNKIRLFGSHQLPEEELRHILKNQAIVSRHTVLVTQELSNHEAELQESLKQQNIAVVVRLYTHSGTVGFLILGEKKSGNPYTRQDIKLLNIVSEEVALAIQNALHFEEIERFNITLQQKINDATKKLRQTNEKLKQLDEAKDEFISMASHQLRTPLTSVKGYVSMVLEGDTGKLNAMQRKLLDQAFLSSQRMVYLIADLLNVSRLHTGKFVIDAKPTNLADVVEGELQQLTETAKARSLELEYEKPTSFPTLNLDETKIRQVVMNFADNAIYYTPHGGHIVVKLTETPESIEFTVNDDGLGVPKADQPHLFNKFYRAGNARKARPDGTGLGLFMAKKVVVAQGGAVIFKSQEGKGSTFGFSFPRHNLEVK